MHFRVVLPLAILGRIGGVDDGRTDHGVARDLQPVLPELLVDQLEQLAATMVLDKRYLWLLAASC